MGRIRTADDLLPESRQYRHMKPAEAHVAAYWRRFPIEGLPKAVVRGKKIPARVNDGNWLANCPNPECSGAEMISFVDPRFFCMSCGNAHVEGRWIEVSVPSPAKRAEIERLLEERIERRLFNWEPEESLAALRAQNKTLVAAVKTGFGSNVVDLGSL